MSELQINYQLITVTYQALMFDAQFLSYIFAAKEYKRWYVPERPKSKSKPL